MDAAHLARVQFLVRPDAWAAWTLLNPPVTEGSVAGEALLNLALTEYRDLRLVAAYVLETVCADARRSAADAQAQLKRIKVGPIELERVTNTANKLGVQADQWCSLAADLRRQVAGESTTRHASRTVCLPVEVRF